MHSVIFLSNHLNKMMLPRIEQCTIKEKLLVPIFKLYILYMKYFDFTGIVNELDCCLLSFAPLMSHVAVE